MSKYAISFKDSPSMTKQSFKDECDINNILDRYQRTGMIDHLTKHNYQYGDFDPVEYHDAMNTIAEGNTMFEELPSKVRAYFEGDPQKFMEYAQDEANIEQLREWGLAKPYQHVDLPDPPQTETTPVPEEDSSD